MSQGRHKVTRATGARKKEPSDILLGDIRELIEETRNAVSTTVNAGLTMLYWRIGKRINQEVLKGERAEYGAEIVVTLSRELSADYGSGFAEKNLRRMVQFCQTFPEEGIVVTLGQKRQG